MVNLHCLFGFHKWKYHSGEFSESKKTWFFCFRCEKTYTCKTCGSWNIGKNKSGSICTCKDCNTKQRREFFR